MFGLVTVRLLTVTKDSHTNLVGIYLRARIWHKCCNVRMRTTRRARVPLRVRAHALPEGAATKGMCRRGILKKQLPKRCVDGQISKVACQHKKDVSTGRTPEAARAPDILTVIMPGPPRGAGGYPSRPQDFLPPGFFRIIFWNFFRDSIRFNLVCFSLSGWFPYHVDKVPLGRTRHFSFPPPPSRSNLELHSRRELPPGCTHPPPRSRFPRACVRFPQRLLDHLVAFSSIENS